MTSHYHSFVFCFMGICASTTNGLESKEEINTNSSLLFCMFLVIVVLSTTAISTNYYSSSDDSVIQAPRMSSSKSDILCGVSNVIYRKEFGYFCCLLQTRYIQSIYAPTSEELGSGASGSVCVVVDRFVFEMFLK